MDQTSPSNTHKRSIEALSVMTLQGRWLVLARVTWLCLAGLYIALFAVDSSIGFVSLQHVCSYAQCGEPYLSAQDVPQLAQLGLSVTFFATYFLVVVIIFALVWVVVGFLIFLRKSNEARALFIAFFLVSFGTIIAGSPTNSLAEVYPSWSWLATAMDVLGLSCLLLFLYLFPNGRFAPHWMRWPALVSLLMLMLGEFFPNSPLNTSNGGLAGVIFLVLIGTVLFSQVYRYVRQSTPVERQQTKWVLFGIALFGLIYAVAAIFGPANGVMSQLVGNTAFYLALLAIPVAIAISILRYRLWDIDALINKALVYGLLTGILAALFAGLVIGLGSLVQHLTGQTSQPVVLVISTLAIYALFNPLRRRIQNMIDRRFYRRKYDAQKTLAAFSATLRTDVDLEDVCEQLVTIVQETMQPEHVSLWLVKPNRREQ